MAIGDIKDIARTGKEDTLSIDNVCTTQNRGGIPRFAYALNGNILSPRNSRKTLSFLLTLFFAFILSFTAFQGKAYAQGTVKVVSSAMEMRDYLISQPPNSPYDPITIKMNTDSLLVFQGINAVIKPAGKYINLDLSGSSIAIIPDNTFEECTWLAGIIIPNSVRSIGAKAFRSCTNLLKITIPNSVTSIGTSAFETCTNLLNITIPNSVTSIGASAFLGCTTLVSITIPNSVTSIDRSSFSGCTSLNSVTIGTGVTDIGWHAFHGCTSLTSVTFNGTIPINKLDNSAFGELSGSIGDLRTKYSAGGRGTYTRASSSTTWTKK